MATRLPKGYTPSEKEPFMNAKQKEFLDVNYLLGVMILFRRLRRH